MYCNSVMLKWRRSLEWAYAEMQTADSSGVRAYNQHGGVKLDANTAGLPWSNMYICAAPTTAVYPTRRSA